MKNSELRYFIKKVLNENFIKEDYPTSFNLEHFKTLKSFKYRVAYCDANLKKIGAGSSRIVYKVDEEKVLKLAKNKKGISQNEIEIQYGRYSDLDGIVAKIFDSDESNLWVEMELAKKISNGDFKRITGFNFEDFAAAINNYGNEVDSKINRRSNISVDPELVNQMWKDEFVYGIFNFIGNYNLPVGDLKRLNSYGIVKRDGQDMIVLVDFGLTEEVYSSHYTRMEEGINESDNLKLAYNKWKRENVTLRGIKEYGQENGAGAMLGNGLYTAALGNRDLAKQYGQVNFVLNGKPKYPIVFNDLNKWEIWKQGLVYKTLGYKDIRQFNEKTDITTEIQKLGYDGVVIKGREMVNYSPSDNVVYFQNENQLIDYYKRNIEKKEEQTLYEGKENNLLKNILDSDAAYEILDSTQAAGSTWMQGGCAILAFALNKAYVYPVYAIYDNDLKQIDHFVVKTPNNEFLDYTGEHKNIIDAFKEDEGLWGKDLSLVPYSNKLKNNGIVIDNKASLLLAKLMLEGNQKKIEETLFEEGKKKLNKYLYHKANPFNRDRIIKNGIVPFRGDQWMSDTNIKGEAVFATNSDNIDDWFDSTYDDDVWRIDTAKIPNIKWFMDPNFNLDKKYKHIYTKSAIPKDAIELIKKGTGEDLLEQNKQKPLNETENSDLSFEEKNGKIYFKDSMGGYGFLTKKDGNINIIDWHSVPLEKKYSPEESIYKRRGFARKVIQGIKKMGYDSFTINMPSSDAIAALNTLSEKGIIKPILGSEKGLSVSSYYTKYTINESTNNIWIKGGILLIKGEKLEDGTQKLFATHIENLNQHDRIKVDAKFGQPAKMATLTGELYRLVIEDGKLKTYRVDWSNEKSLTKSLKFYGQAYHVVLNNNKTPLHWETLQMRYMPDIVNKLGSEIMRTPNIKWALK